MLTSVRVQNYRCLRDVTVELGPLTVLVGPNGSGKSSLLDVLSKRYDNLVGDPWRGDEKAEVKAEYHLGTKVLRGERQKALPLSRSLLRMSLPAMRKPNIVQRATQLDESCGNIHNVVYTLGRAGQAELAERFCRLVPAYADIDTYPTEKGQHWTRFRDRWAPDLWFDPHHVSDGTLFVLAFVVAAMQPSRPELLLIEEPERGLHPWLLGQIVDLLRELSAPTDGSIPVQVVAATHSADLLRHLRPEEVRFVGRDPKTGETRVTGAPTSAPGWSQALEAYDSLAELWLSGALGGVPGR